MTAAESGLAGMALDGRLADNIVFFARVLRKAGLRIGPAAVTDAIEAVRAIGIGEREEFYTALHATLVKRHEDDAVFDEAFRLFWRSRDLVGTVEVGLPAVEGRQVGSKRILRKLALQTDFVDRKEIDALLDNYELIVSQNKFRSGWLRGREEAATLKLAQQGRLLARLQDD